MLHYYTKPNNDHTALVLINMGSGTSDVFRLIIEMSIIIHTIEKFSAFLV